MQALGRSGNNPLSGILPDPVAEGNGPPSLLNRIWTDHVGGVKGLGVLVVATTLRELSKSYLLPYLPGSSLLSTVGAFGLYIAFRKMVLEGYFDNPANEQDLEGVDVIEMYLNTLGEELDLMTLHAMHESQIQEGGVVNPNDDRGQDASNNGHLRQD